jgi:hypothetical protein
LERQKDFTNNLCVERGLSVTVKGKHFDGSELEQGELRAWGKDKYNLLQNEAKKSFVTDCAIAIMEVVPNCSSREDFISQMEKRGWHTSWAKNKKHITFSNDNGEKVRDSNISKTFNMNISKEGLINEFTRQNELRLAKLNADRAKEFEAAEYAKYYAEVESAIAGLDSAKTIRYDTEASVRDSGVDQHHTKVKDGLRTNNSGNGASTGKWQTSRFAEDTDAFLRNLESQEQASGEKRDNLIAERQNWEDEQIRLNHQRKAGIRDSEVDQHHTKVKDRPRRDNSGNGTSEGKRQTRRFANDTDAFLRNLESQEQASGEKRDNLIAERQNRKTEQIRLNLERERAAREEQQRLASERATRKNRSQRHDFSR